jgi:hypothetical protein
MLVGRSLSCGNLVAGAPLRFHPHKTYPVMLMMITSSSAPDLDRLYFQFAEPAYLYGQPLELVDGAPDLRERLGALRRASRPQRKHQLLGAAGRRASV